MLTCLFLLILEGEGIKYCNVTPAVFYPPVLAICSKSNLCSGLNCAYSATEKILENNWKGCLEAKVTQCIRT